MLGKWPDRLPSAVLQAAGYWDVQHHPHFRPASHAHPPTIAISREEGAGGPQIAREVGAQLHWPVFDHELLERIADKMNVRVGLVESVDEHRQDWLLECLKSLAPPQSSVSQPKYMRHLMETLLALAAHGNCVIVGRGAAQMLPPATTIAVRVVAPLEDRVTRLSDEEGISKGEAGRHIAKKDRERLAFIKDNFHTDARDPAQYDVVVNRGRLSTAQSVQVIVAALEARHPGSPSDTPKPTKDAVASP